MTILANAYVDAIVPIITALGGVMTTLVLGYFKYKQAVDVAQQAAIEKAKEDAEKKFDDQLQNQAFEHKQMLQEQKEAFEKQLDELRTEKKVLLNKIESLEKTIEDKVEQIIDLATENSRRQGILEVLQNDGTIIESSDSSEG